MPLHQHSEHSFLDGYSSVDRIAERARELGLSAAALTDHGECGGHVQFDKACRRAGVKPVFGMEGYWVKNAQSTLQARSRANSHITVLARDQEGLRNLWALSSRAYGNLQAGRFPLADVAMLRDHAAGLWASDGCLMTEFATAVDKGDEGQCREIYGTLAGVFGDRFFVELHTWQLVDPQNDRDRDLNARMGRLNGAKERLAREMGLPLVVVNDNHYTRPEEWENHALVWEMNTHGSGDQLERGRAAGHLMSDDEIVHWMGKHGISRSVTEEAIRTSGVIADDCNAEIPRTLALPRMTGSDAEDTALFVDLVDAGFRDKVARHGLDEDVYGQRMADEARVIIDKGFAGYFNIVADYARAARTGEYGKWIGKDRPGMLVGPGRGSAGGSLVAWLLGITSVDPIRYGLLFERFISADRKDWPDIDIDFPQSKRDEVKDYIVARHGADRVCGIGTRSTSRPKGVLADLCRVKGIPFDERMRMSRIFDAAREDDWDAIMRRQSTALKPYIAKYPQLFAKIGEMVGIVRQPGTHPAGVIINNEPLLGLVPTRTVKGAVTTQFDMGEVEALGGVKDDLLGLRHLDTLEAAAALVLDRTGVALDYCSFDDELRDPDIWAAIDRGDTAGVFQLETAGGTEDAMRFKPRNEVDVADLISVNRPGVIDAGLKDKYMARRAGLEPDVFDHPLMEVIVGDTHGVLVYQEQMMRAARVLAGFTGEEAEGLRKAIGKKLADRLPALERKFVDGCLANPAFTGPAKNAAAAEKAARKVWASMDAAGRYAFNKSHAVGYALISTWEIWLKHHHGVEFLVALMQTDSANATKYARDLRRRGVELWQPDVNLSDRKMAITEAGVRYGLDSVRGVGAAAVEDLISQRPFVSFDDYFLRVDPSLAGRREVVENLLLVGAFDSLGDRTQLCRTWRSYASDKSPVPDFSDDEVVADIEKRLIGHYVTADPMARFADAIDQLCVKSASALIDATPGDVLRVGGQVTSVRTVKVKRGPEKGRDMAHMTVTWNDEDYEIAVFCDAWASARPLLRVGAPVACQVVKTERGVHLSLVERLDMLAKGAK